jgi:hypothetical protein
VPSVRSRLVGARLRSRFLEKRTSARGVAWWAIASGLVSRTALRSQAGTQGLRPIFARPAIHVRPALVIGADGVVVTMDGRPMTVMGFSVAEGKIVEIDAIADPERVRRIAATVLSD